MPPDVRKRSALPSIAQRIWGLRPKNSRVRDQGLCPNSQVRERTNSSSCEAAVLAKFQSNQRDCPVDWLVAAPRLRKFCLLATQGSQSC